MRWNYTYNSLRIPKSRMNYKQIQQYVGSNQTDTKQFLYVKLVTFFSLRIIKYIIIIIGL
jgi:hypothetical protein